MVVKTLYCTFSGLKIYPGHGSLYARVDCKRFYFASSKAAADYHMKRNPRKISWTVFYRRLHKKGLQEDQKRKRARRVGAAAALRRGFTGMDATVLASKRAETGAMRKANRDASVSQVKAKKKEKE